MGDLGITYIVLFLPECWSYRVMETSTKISKETWKAKHCVVGSDSLQAAQEREIIETIKVKSRLK